MLMSFRSLRSKLFTLRFFVLLGVLTGVALSANATPMCNPQFSLQTGQKTGWLGADVAFSIPLQDGRDLWIFGDTLYGEKRTIVSGTPPMVRNSIGVSSCGLGETWNIRYVIRKGPQGKPEDYFHEQKARTWYWAMDGFRAGANVWVTLLCVRATDPNSALGFETCGTDLAKISNLGSDPQKWTIRYFPLVPDGVNAYPSATTVIDGNFAELFAQDQKGSKPLVVTRVALDGLADPRGALQYLSRENKWEHGFDPLAASPVMAKGSPELSIRYHPELKQWLAVMFAPAPFSRDILLRSAPSPTGPWSSGKVIYSVPEMTPGNANYDKDTFCYAGKEHPEFEHGDLVITYVCNTFAIPKLVNELNIYFPQVVRLPIPEASVLDDPSRDAHQGVPAVN